MKTNFHKKNYRYTYNLNIHVTTRDIQVLVSGKTHSKLAYLHARNFREVHKNTEREPLCCEVFSLQTIPCPMGVITTWL